MCLNSINKANVKWMLEYYYLFIVSLENIKEENRLTADFKMSAEVWAQVYKPGMRQ